MVGRPGKYQPRFTAGELDPLLGGNTDIGDYSKGASLMQNARPYPQGGFGNMPGTRSLGEVPAGVARIRSFTHRRADAYDLVFTAGRADVYGATGAHHATVALALTADQLATFKTVQQLETMVMFHQEVKPIRLRRAGSDTDWTVDDAPFQNIPNFDYGDAYTNGKAAVWSISFFNATAGSSHYVLSVNGVDTQAILYIGVTETDRLAIEAAVLALPGVSPGVTVTGGVANTPGGTPIADGNFGIEFSGAGNEGDGWAVSGQFVDKADAAVTSAHLVAGVLGGEPIMSATRGWPGCGAFYGARLVIGGFKGLPNAFLASQSSNYWNLDTRLTTASAPMLVPVDVDGAATILDIHKGRTLDLFTDAGEYWLSGAALDRTVVPTIVLATSIGLTPGVPVVENEGATIYAGLAEADVAAQDAAASGGTLQEFKFDYSQQNYASLNMSVRASGLVADLVDMTLRRGVRATDLAQLWALRGDGLAVVAHLLRGEQITAFTRRATDGLFKAVNCNDRRQLTFVVERMVGGVATQFVERQEEGLLLDQAVDFDLGAPGVTVTGLAALEGASVWAVADRYVQGPFTVTAGAITLGEPATAGYVGRWTPLRVKTLPQPRDIAPRTVMRRPCRIHTVRVKVLATTSIAIGANDEPPEEFDLSRFGGAADVAPLDAPYSGEVVAEGLQGFSDDGVVEITQLRPGLLTVIGVTVEVDL